MRITAFENGLIGWGSKKMGKLFVGLFFFCNFTPNIALLILRQGK